jgi:hypothetical protein
MTCTTMFAFKLQATSNHLPISINAQKWNSQHLTKQKTEPILKELNRVKNKNLKKNQTWNV